MINLKKCIFMEIPFFILAICLLLFGCGSKGAPEKIIAEINNYRMTSDDFSCESKEIYDMGRVLGDMPMTKEDILDALITKEVLLQEAQKEDLDKDKEFMKTIELYWEETLIRNLLKNKTDEIEKNTAVSESEIEGYYDKMPIGQRGPLPDIKDEIINLIKAKKEKEMLDEWINSLRSKARVKINKKALEEIK